MGGLLYRRAGELALLCDEAGEGMRPGGGVRWWGRSLMAGCPFGYHYIPTMMMLTIYELT